MSWNQIRLQNDSVNNLLQEHAITKQDKGKTTTQAIIQACKGMDSENKRINSC